MEKQVMNDALIGKWHPAQVGCAPSPYPDTLGYNEHIAKLSEAKQAYSRKIAATERDRKDAEAEITRYQREIKILRERIVDFDKEHGRLMRLFAGVYEESICEQTAVLNAISPMPSRKPRKK